MIISRELQPGQRVTQAQLAAMLDVSTMPIREALLRLVAEGLVVAEANRSFSVTNTTADSIRDIYWMHAVLAAELTGRGWDNRTPQLLTTLAEQHETYAKSLGRGTQEDLFEANWRFHSSVHRAAAAPALGLMLKNTLHFFPDFTLPVPGWTELASRWQAGLLEQFTHGTREGAEQVARSSVITASQLFIDSYWIDPAS